MDAGRPLGAVGLKNGEQVKRKQVSILMIAFAAIWPVVSGLLAEPAWPQDAALTYKIYCARCHGTKGAGDGPDAATLKAHPRDFRDCHLMSTISDDTMFKAIKDGGAAVNLPADMPAWNAGLDDKQIHSLIKHIRGFCSK